MENINDYRKRFGQLMESTMGDVRPLISEQESTTETMTGKKLKGYIDENNAKQNGTPDFMGEITSEPKIVGTSTEVSFKLTDGQEGILSKRCNDNKFYVKQDGVPAAANVRFIPDQVYFTEEGLKIMNLMQAPCDEYVSTKGTDASNVS